MIHKRLTYANAMATIAVVLAMGGASAVAAEHLGKNSVGSRQLRPNAVTGAKVKDGSLGGADIVAATLGEVPSARHAESADVADSAKTSAGADRATSAEHADAAPPVGPAGGDLVGSYPNPVMRSKAIGTEKLADGAVTGAKLATAAVGKGNIAPAAVTGPSLAGIFEIKERFFGTRFIHGPDSANELTVQCPTGSHLLSGGFETDVIGTSNITSSMRSENGWAISGFVNGTSNVPVFVIAYCLAAS